MSYQAYLDTIKEKTGKSPQDFRAIADAKGLLAPDVKAGAVIAWLKDDFGLGHGHAMALYGAIKPASGPRLSLDQEVDKHFAGRRAAWKPTYARLQATFRTFGDDVSVQPTNSYISVLRRGRKFSILQVTGDRFDVGIKLKGTDATDRLQTAGLWNAMVTHRVRIAGPDQVDPQLVGWLRRAYDAA